MEQISLEFSPQAHSQLKRLLIVTGPGYEQNISVSKLKVFFKNNMHQIEDWVSRGGGFYFKDFPIKTPEAFYQILNTINSNLIPYTGTKVRNSLNHDSSYFLYSPTSTPSYRKNFLHNEMAYQVNIPNKIAFYCEKQAKLGGESILSDQNSVYQSIPSDVRTRLETKKLLFVRHLISKRKWHDVVSRYFDVFSIFPCWQNNFQTDDKLKVDQVCRANGIKTHWNDKNNLTLSCVIDPARIDPITNEKMWVNNCHVFQLHKKVFGSFLYYSFKLFFWITRLPMTTCLYGDGTPIESETLETLIESLDSQEVSIRLMPGDFIYLHNHNFGHGRKTFKGKRKMYFTLLD